MIDDETWPYNCLDEGEEYVSEIIRELQEVDKCPYECGEHYESHWSVLVDDLY